MTLRENDDEATMLTPEQKLEQWGVGPWLHEDDRIEWYAHGLPCLMTRALTGHLCGYVAVPPGHALHGKDPDCLRVRQIIVHGGINYAKACSRLVCHVPRPGEPDNVWWFGFDCMHGHDYVPATMHAFAPVFDMPSVSRRHGLTYRDVPFVRAHINLLAMQLAAAARPAEQAAALQMGDWRVAPEQKDETHDDDKRR
jgi:hypothetical protein